MKIIDSHVHLYPKPLIDKEFHLDGKKINIYLKKLSKKIIKEKISKALVYILDENFIKYNIKIPENLILGLLVESGKDLEINLEKLVNTNIKIIKILPYEQELTSDKYRKIVSIAKAAKKKQMVITICCTYGSGSVYRVNGIDLAANIRNEVDIPIILAHGGGPDIFEAMTLALKYDNIFFDLSFSLKYWWDSSVIRNYAFAIKKLNCERFFYGSDFPYVSFNESKKYFNLFIKKFSFSKKEEYQLLYENFINFKRKYL